MKEKFSRDGEHINIGTIGVKHDGVTYDETMKAIRQINRDYSRKLIKKLILLYGKNNAISIYNKMKQESEEELQELIELSNISVDEPVNNLMKR